MLPDVSVTLLLLAGSPGGWCEGVLHGLWEGLGAESPRPGCLSWKQACVYSWFMEQQSTSSGVAVGPPVPAVTPAMPKQPTGLAALPTELCWGPKLSMGRAMRRGM